MMWKAWFFGELVNKLRNRTLTDQDRELLEELALVSGWDKKDKIRELLGMQIDYAELHRKYLKEAYELKEKGDFANAGKKLWGATTALFKKALSDVPHDMDEWIEWSRPIIDKYITRYGKELEDVLRELLDRAWSLYDFSMRFCYDGDAETFGYLWERVVESLLEARKALGYV
jgi:HPt (histidine-containing phosphotransfer) domain-containing protein